VFLANGALLLLPGSNLTNLIVIEDRHLSGGAFTATMLSAWIATCLVISLVLTAFFRPQLGAASSRDAPRTGPRLGIGLVGVGVAVIAMLVLPVGTGAVVVLATGVLAVAWRLAGGRLKWVDVQRTVRYRLLAGLFGLAVGLGGLGRIPAVSLTR
jgi:Na+/H+ antiporter NhaD/arsenite permease-like protein